MEVINLSKKVVKPILLNGLECICVLDNTTIDYYQRVNKIGFLKGLELMEKNEIKGVKKLIGSIVREKKTGRILGEKHFNQFNDLEIVAAFTPVIKELLPNLPEAKEESEKK
jgi:hypothetical protein|nr:MAG TPA: hypothetical protein [Caudoviricetes sp.]